MTAEAAALEALKHERENLRERIYTKLKGAT